MLKDGKPKEFNQILPEVGVSHNTLRHYVELLIDNGLVERRKRPSMGPRGPDTPIACQRGLVDGQFPLLQALIKGWSSCPLMV